MIKSIINYKDKQVSFKKVCPETGLEIKKDDKFIDIELTDTYRVSFCLIGDKILYSAPKGNCGDSGMQKFYEKRDEFIKLMGLSNLRFIEIKDYSRIKGHSRNERKYFLKKIVEDRDSGRLLGFWGIGTSFLIRLAFRIGLKFYQPGFSVELVNDYKTAVHDALARLKRIDLRKNIYLPEKCWNLNLENFSVKFKIIDDNIVFSKSEGVWRSGYSKKFFELLKNILYETGIEKKGKYYRIADWSGVEKSQWKARQEYIKELKNLDKIVKCKFSALIGLNQFMKLMLNSSKKIIPFKVECFSNFDEALESIKSIKSKKRILLDKHENKNIYTGKEIDEQVRLFLHFLGGFDWDYQEESFKEFEPKVTFQFKPLFDSIILLKNDFDDIIKEKNAARKIISKQNRFEKLRTEIWKIASESISDEDVLIKRLLDEVGPALGLSRASYNIFDGDDPEKSNLICVIEWCDKDVKPSIDTKLPSFLVNYFRKTDLFHFTIESALNIIPRKFRHIAKPMMKVLGAAMNVESWAILPHYVDSNLKGWFTFDICRNNPHKPDMNEDVRELIREMVDIVSRHIARKQIDKALQKSYDELEERVEERTIELLTANEKLQQEIKDRKEAENVLKESERKYRALFNQIVDPVVIFDKSTYNFLDWNNAVERIYGYSPEEFETMTPYDLHPPEELERVRNNIDNVSDKNLNIYTHIKKNGNTMVVEISIDEIMYQDKPAWISIIRDITERKKSEDKLKRSREQLQTILDSMPFCVMIISKDRIIRRVNHAAVKLAGYDFADQLLGKVCNDTICPTNQKDCPIFDLEQPVDRSERNLAVRSGGQIPILKSVIPIIIDDEEVLLEAFVDITEIQNARLALEKAKQAAETANRMKTQFLANISHEIRTPLNAILGFSEIIMTMDNIKDIHQHANIILRESETLIYLINMLLDHAKIEAGKIELDYISVDLYLLMDQISRSVVVHTNAKGLNFNLNMNKNVPQYIKADAVRLKEVLVNLTGNAVKFTEKGSVNVDVNAVKSSKNEVELSFSIKDTGIGIPKNKQSMIFESFTQADGTTTRKYGGTGLGITISQNLVELMGGKIGLKSKPGKGSTFWFTITCGVCTSVLKIDEKMNAPDDFDIKAVRSKAVSNAQILLAEDYQPNQEVIKNHLKQVGYKVDIAENGKKAVDACKKNHYDLILLDVQMPVMDGYETVQKIRSLASPVCKVPVIGLTAHAGDKNKNLCLKSGMDDVITKPVRRNLLLYTIDKWLGLSRTGTRKDAEKVNTGTAGKKDVPMDFTVVENEFGSKEMVEKVVKQFLTNVDEQLNILKEAVETENYKILKKECHKIKGGASTLEARPLTAAANRMERFSKAEKSESIREAYDQFVIEYNRLKRFIKTRNNEEKLKKEKNF